MRLTLVGVLSTTEQLIMLIFRQINTVISELRTLEVEAIGVRHDLLHGRNLDLVGDRLVVDRVANLVILHHEYATLR